MFKPSFARFTGVDFLRGVALLLMLIDHFAVGLASSYVWRLPGRLALPLFMLVAGGLFTVAPGRIWKRRYTEILLVGLACVPFEMFLGIGQPGILLVFVALVPVLGTIISSSSLGAVVSAVSLSIPVPWSGPHPGYVLLFFFLGRLIDWRKIKKWSFRPLEIIGQYPLTFYFCHLVLISVMVMI